MVGMTMRNFHCTLCGNAFEMVSGDLILPGPQICDPCLREVWNMDDDTLKHHIRRHLSTQHAITYDQLHQHIQWHKTTFVSADEAIQKRKNLIGG